MARSRCYLSFVQTCTGILVLTLVGCAAPCTPTRDVYGRIARSQRVLAAFRKAVPCPSTGKADRHCPGYVIDHVRPLCACGVDAVNNLQWQKIEDAKAKDQQEWQLCKGN
jgi:hypothetical protein